MWKAGQISVFSLKTDGLGPYSNGPLSIFPEGRGDRKIDVFYGSCSLDEVY